MTDGVLVVDKPAGWTSHDVVAWLRRRTGTRRVGHAGTLDPMATGVLVVGLGRATRLLGYLTRSEKEYFGTVVLGVRTDTDDATGQVLATADPTGVTDEQIVVALTRLTGRIEQVPPAVSAVQVRGERAYRMVRKGQPVQLPARPVDVRVLELRDRRGPELDIRVVCSAGTYVRALARDLGSILDVGAHLSGLRRVRSGSFRVEDACTLPQLEVSVEPLPLAAAAVAAFPRLDVSEEQAGQLRHGRSLPSAGLPAGPVAVLAPDGGLLALVEERDEQVRPLCVFG